MFKVWIEGIYLRAHNIHSKAIEIPSTPDIHTLLSGSTAQIETNYFKNINIPKSKIVLTDKQIKRFSNLALQFNNGSITLEQAILKLRGGGGLTELAAILTFVLFVNCYNSLFGVEGF